MNNSVLLEIGVEELPARFVIDASKQLENHTQIWLEKNMIKYHSVESFSTPRRLSIMIHNINETQDTVTEKVRGPHMDIAKDSEGHWSKAAIGFTKGHGKTVEDIFIEPIKGKEYIFINKTTEGQDVKKLLIHLNDIIDKIQFSQTMNWGEKSYRFARPIRWLVALWNSQIIPTEVAGVKANRLTYGHRFLGEKVTIEHALDYESILHDQYVIPKFNERKKMIVSSIHNYETENNVNITIDEDLLNEVTNLVEYPTLFIGDFSNQFLTLPEEVLITSMKEHQRYFPVFNNDGKQLLAKFVGIRNGNAAFLDNVVKGNEKVLRARLQDAEFFYAEDQKQSIEFFNEKLKNVIYQEKIGTTYEIVQKVRSLTSILCNHLNVSESVVDNVKRAAEISKFDLVTNMVNEFPELQGVMGEKYATYFGENEKVAQAIREHYLPTSAQGSIPSSKEGSILAVCDKLVTIMSCFNVGLNPTGSQDPLGLRRQANGILNISNTFEWKISIETLLDLANQVFEISDENTLNQLKHFFKERMIYLFGLEQFENDIIQAVLSNELGIISLQREKIKILTHIKYDADFKATQESLVRVINLAKKEFSNKEINPRFFQTDSEKTLYEITREKEKSITLAIENNDFEQILNELQTLSDPVNQFFEENMIMTDDEQVKNNRLSLIQKIAKLTMHFGDITQVEWKQLH